MAQRLLSREREAELLKRYPHEGNNQLAVEFGITAAQVANIAFSKDVRKTPAARSVLSSRGRSVEGQVNVMQLVLATVKAAGTAGMSRSDLAAARPDIHIGNTMHSLATRGHLHSAGLHGAMRWFSQLADAQAHAAACGKAYRPSISKRTVARLQRAACATVNAPAVNAAPAPVVQPLPSPPGLFSALGPGQYLDEAPNTWVAAITRRA